jgi:hypothetical protein
MEYQDYLEEISLDFHQYGLHFVNCGKRDYAVSRFEMDAALVLLEWQCQIEDSNPQFALSLTA